MSLVKCAVCGREISPNAATCPHCGERRKPRDVAFYFWAVMAILFALILAFGIASIRIGP